MLSPVERAEAMKAIAGYTDADIALVRESMNTLTGKIGSLMAAVNTRLISGKGEEYLFDDDPEIARAFGMQLADFVMRSSAGNFTPEYCAWASGFATRLKPQPPLSAFVAVNAVIAQWLTSALADIYKDNPAKLGATLSAWQRMLAVNMELLTTPYDE